MGQQASKRGGEFEPGDPPKRSSRGPNSVTAESRPARRRGLTWRKPAAPSIHLEVPLSLAHCKGSPRRRAAPRAHAPAHMRRGIGGSKVAHLLPKDDRPVPHSPIVLSEVRALSADVTNKTPHRAAVDPRRTGLEMHRDPAASPGRGVLRCRRDKPPITRTQRFRSAENERLAVV